MPMSTQWTHERSQCEQAFWNYVSNGSSWTAACEAVGVDRRQGYRWRKAAGGRIPTAPRIISGRYLSLDERLRIADAHLAGDGVRAIAATLGRAPSTIGRELRRNASTPPTSALRPRRPLGRVTCEPYAAHRRAAQRGLRPKVAKLDDPVIGPVLSAYVEAKMELRWSPQQIAHELAVDFPAQEELRVSHETIYQSLYVQGRGYLRADLHRQLRTGRAQRRAATATRHGAWSKVPGAISISERPAEADDRAVPGHWEGDLCLAPTLKEALIGWTSPAARIGMVS